MSVDVRARILYSEDYLSKNDRVSMCADAKEIWDTIKVTHLGRK